MIISPILLFTYKRLEVLKQTVLALQQNNLSSQSDLYIFSDAAKEKKDEAIIYEIRLYLKSITGFKSISIIEAKTNKGLANSIVEGVSQIIEKFGRVIVLEDDLKTTANFLSYMNLCLNQYENDKDVFSVSGYSFDLGNNGTELNDAYFLNRGWSWGWATWSDRWSKVDWQVKDYAQFSNDKGARRLFAAGGSDLNSMLDKQMSGELDSWAIRWFYHQFRIKGLTVYPVHSKVYNDGFDENATHTTGSNKRYLPSMDKTNNLQFSLPSEIKVSNFYQKKFQDKMGIWSRILSRIESFLQIPRQINS